MMGLVAGSFKQMSGQTLDWSSYMSPMTYLSRDIYLHLDADDRDRDVEPHARVGLGWHRVVFQRLYSGACLLQPNP
jgi:hypothetical protein